MGRQGGSWGRSCIWVWDLRLLFNQLKRCGTCFVETRQGRVRLVQVRSGRRLTVNVVSVSLSSGLPGRRLGYSKYLHWMCRVSRIRRHRGNTAQVGRAARKLSQQSRCQPRCNCLPGDVRQRTRILGRGKWLEYRWNWLHNWSKTTGKRRIYL